MLSLLVSRWLKHDSVQSLSDTLPQWKISHILTILVYSDAAMNLNLAKAYTPVQFNSPDTRVLNPVSYMMSQD